LTIAEADAADTSRRSAIADVDTGSSLRLLSDQIALA
jgi:hypothetical protein